MGIVITHRNKIGIVMAPVMASVVLYDVWN